MRFRKIGSDYIITNDAGEWVFLNEKEFEKFRQEKIEENDKVYQKLHKAGFINTGQDEMIEQSRERFQLSKSSFYGPTLFILVLTLRCNHRCLYCQVLPSGENSDGFDMTEGTAKKIVDLIFRAPSKSVRIEFQGGEPILNWPVLKYVVKYAKVVNKKKKKNLQISLVSNLTVLSDEKLKFLLDEDVSICSSFDGPAEIHDKNRIYLDGKSSHEVVVAKMKKIQKALINRNSKLRKKYFSQNLDALLTVSRFSLKFHRKIVDEYIRRGFKSIFIRPLSHFGLKIQNISKIGYNAEEFIDYYKKSMDYILELNLKGEAFVERNAFYILKKIMEKTDPGYLDMRSPCGAGIGQIAFNYDGKIYTCDEGRMAARMGYDNFQIGTIGESEYNQLIDNEIVKTTCLASCLDNHVSCSNCVYNPFCGVCPVANFVEYGNIFPQIPNTDRCKINKAMFDYIFSKIRQKKYKNIFETWLSQPLYPIPVSKKFSKKTE